MLDGFLRAVLCGLIVSLGSAQAAGVGGKRQRPDIVPASFLTGRPLDGMHQGLPALDAALDILAAHVRGYLQQRLLQQGSAPRMEASFPALIAVLRRDVKLLVEQRQLLWDEDALARCVQQTWWHVIADVGDLRSGGGRWYPPEKPVMAVVLEKAAASERLALFKLISSWGAFLPASRAAIWREEADWEPLSFVYWRAYLLAPDSSDEPGLRQALWEAFLAPTGLASELWQVGDEYALHQQKAQWLRRHQRRFVASFLSAGWWEPAYLWVETLANYGLPILDLLPHSRHSAMIALQVPLLEQTLHRMAELEGRWQRTTDASTWEHGASFRSILPQHAFAPATSKLRLATQMVPVSGASEQAGTWDLIWQYCQAGRLRDAILRQLGQYVSDDWPAGARRSHLLINLLRYLRDLDEPGSHMDVQQGYEVFLLSRLADGSNLLEKTTARQASFVLSLMLALVDKRRLLDQQASVAASLGSLFHLALPQNSSDPSGLHGNLASVHEEGALAVCRLLIATLQRHSDELSVLLRQKNAQGRTPLLLAAEAGYERVFNLLRLTLQELSAYDEEEHARAGELSVKLLKGMLAQGRLQSTPALRRSIAHLERRVERQAQQLKSLASYRPGQQGPHQRHMETTTARLRQLLTIPLVPRYNPAKYLYQPAFRELYHHLHGQRGGPKALRSFGSAPASVQVSYYEPGLRLIIDHMRQDFAGGHHTVDELMQALMGSYEHFLPPAVHAFCRRLLSEGLLEAPPRLAPRHGAGQAN